MLRAILDSIRSPKVAPVKGFEGVLVDTIGMGISRHKVSHARICNPIHSQDKPFILLISLCHQSTLSTLDWCTHTHNLYVCFWFQVDFQRIGFNILLSDVLPALPLRTRYDADRVVNIATNIVNSLSRYNARVGFTK